MPDNFNATPQLFQFNNVATGDSFALSALEKDGQVWFVAADVCKALDLKNPRQAISSLDDDEKGVTTMDTLGGPQQVSIINESGLYSLIFRSRKESTKRFRKWVTAEVIPSIRKHGGYINGQEALSPAAQTETLQVIHKEARLVLSRHEQEKQDRYEAHQALRRLR